MKKKKSKNKFLDNNLYDKNEQIYKVIKVPLKSVIKNKKYDKIQPIIENTVKEINQLVILGYQFLKLYLLDKFNNNKEFPKINKQFILDILKTIFVFFEHGDPVYNLDNHYGSFIELKKALYECIKAKIAAEKDKNKKKNK